jgi:ABC-type transport system involved in multi-copper enzyme maturation permease subunit
MGAGRLARVAAVATNTFRETVRERVLYNLVFFALLMTVSGLVLRELAVRQDDRVIKDLGLAAMDVFGTLIAVFIGVGLVSKEIERRSLYPLLARPLTRGEFLLGKFSGLAFTLLVNVSVMTVGLYATLLAIRLQGATAALPDARLLVAVTALYAGLLVVLAVALLFSTVTSSTMAAVCTAAVVIVGRYADVIRNMQEIVPGMPRGLTELVYLVIPDFSRFDLKNAIVHGESVPLGTLAWIVAYALSYAMVLLALAAAAFRRRDL